MKSKKMKYFFKVVINLSISLIFLTSCASNARIKLVSSGNIKHDLDKLVDIYITVEKIPGMGLLYYSPMTGVIQVVHGLADITETLPLSIDSKYDIGSTTKTFISFLIMNMVDEGKIALDTNVGAWLHDIPHGDEITVSQLLNHTSGIGDYFYSKGLLDKLYATQEITLTRDDLIKLGIDISNHKTIGTHHYSNTNYLVLAKIIEKITGNTIGFELENKIFKPLGMSDTYYMAENKIENIKNLSTGYYLGSPTNDNRNYFLHNSAGSIISTMSDMLKFSQYIMSNPKCLDYYIKTPVESSIESDLKMDYGYGMYRTNQYKDIVLLGHGGLTFGFKSEWWFSEEGDRVLIFFTNAALKNRNFHEFRQILINLITNDQK